MYATRSLMAQSETDSETSSMTHHTTARRVGPMTRMRPTTQALLRQATIHTRHKRIQPSRFTLAWLDQWSRKRLQVAYAPSTWARRTMLEKNWTMFRETMTLPPTSATTIRFFTWLSTNLLDSSLLTYTTTFMAMHPELRSTETDAYIRAIRVTQGLRQTHIVRPLTPDEAYKILSQLPGPLQLAFFLAWKTASRWADVAALRPCDLFPLNPYELVILFPLTKATRLRPFRPDLLVHLVHRTPMYNLLEKLSRIPRKGPITRVSGSQLNILMRRILSDKTVSTRSIKKGAADVLMAAAATNQVSLETVGHVLKHAGTPHPIPDQTVRYTTDKVSLAVAMGTGVATALL